MVSPRYGELPALFDSWLSVLRTRRALAARRSSERPARRGPRGRPGLRGPGRTPGRRSPEAQARGRRGRERPKRPKRPGLVGVSPPQLSLRLRSSALVAFRSSGSRRSEFTYDLMLCSATGAWSSESGSHRVADRRRLARACCLFTRMAGENPH